MEKGKKNIMKITAKNRTSSSYRFTVDIVDGKVASNDTAIVNDLKAVVKTINKAYKNMGAKARYRVKLCGRGPRPSYRYQASLPLPMSKTADVYVYRYV